MVESARTAKELWSYLRVLVVENAKAASTHAVLRVFGWLIHFTSDEVGAAWIFVFLHEGLTLAVYCISGVKTIRRLWREKR